jgi:hypothetical protein
LIRLEDIKFNDTCTDEAGFYQRRQNWKGRGGGLLGQLPPFALFALYKKQGKPTVPLSSNFHTPKIRNV